ncbi:hypothetical protein AO02_02917 [Mycobacterium tuberculosis M1417]|nr:hypothetical protein AO02_02917 [Mycobacterium tuberculosis M1417]
MNFADQTQNPERGRKLASTRRRHGGLPRVVRPKTPRGDGNPTTSSGIQSHGYARSSDPKPREGTETTPRVVPSVSVLLVVRPKTPRGDGNYTTRRAISQRPPRRQTQNPERGRKLEHGAVHMPWLRGVVRPKTPRGDGNNTSVARHTPTNHQVVRPKTPRGNGNFSDHLCGISGLRSSDPKPREGTETPMRRHFRLQFQPVVRPKTPRGDGNLRRASTRGCRLRWSSDPKPREGTETRR